MKIETVDVLIITALEDELDQVINIIDNNSQEWNEDVDSSGFPFSYRDFYRENKTKFTVAVASSVKMGETATAVLATRLVKELKPFCLAMCGICAGLREKASLGDVIVADKVFNYESGKLIKEIGKNGKGFEDKIYHNLTTFNLNFRWKKQVEKFSKEWKKNFKLPKPIPYKVQEDWLLSKLVKDDIDKVTFKNLEQYFPKADRDKHCPGWENIIKNLKDKKLLKKDNIEISAKGKSYISNLLIQHPNGIPTKDFNVHLEPIATGDKVIRDPEIFDRLKTISSNVLGLDMEAAAIGLVAEIEDIIVDYKIVAKAVTDFADFEKDDSFRHFAAAASARFLIDYFCKYLPEKKNEEIQLNLEINISIEFNIDSSRIKEEMTLKLEKSYENEIKLINKLSLKSPNESLKDFIALKQRIWGDCSDETKYNILSHIAKNKLLLKFDDSAANDLIEAEKYLPNNENALNNAALAYLIKGEFNTAKNFAEKIIKINPNNSEAYSIIIDSFPIKEDINELINLIPKSCLESSSVSYSLGISYFFRNNFLEAKNWLEKAINNSKVNSVYIKIDLAKILFLIATENNPLINLDLLSESQKEIIQNSIKLLDNVWEFFNDDLKKVNIEVLATRAFAYRDLKKYDQALENVNEALTIDKDNILFKERKTFLLFESFKFEECSTLCNEIIAQEQKNNIQVRFLLAKSLTQLKKYQEAEKNFLELKKLIENIEAIHQIEEELAILYINSENFSKAEEIINKLIKEENEVLRYRVYKLRIEIYKNPSIIHSKPKEYIELLSNANNIAEKSHEIHDLILYSKELFSIRDYKNLLDLYNKLESKGILPNTNAIHLRRLTAKAALGFPLDEKFLEKLDINKLTLEECSILTMFYMFKKDIKKALEISYNMRENNLNEINCHVDYVNLFVECEHFISASKIEELNKFDTVEIGSIVILKNTEKNEVLLINTEMKDEKFRNLLNKLFNRKRGERVIFEGIEYFIEEIMGKYHFAFFESLKIAEIYAPNKIALRRI